MDAGSGRPGANPTGSGPGAGPRPGTAAVALLFLGLAAACAGPERSEPPVSEEVYVEAMGRLAAIRTATDPGQVAPPMPEERADSLRREVLDRHELTRSDLEQFARRIGDEPERMKALWERIASVSDSLWRAGWPPLSGDRTVRGGRSPSRGGGAPEAPGDTAGGGGP